MVDFLDDPFEGHDSDTHGEMPFVPQWSENQLEIGTFLRYIYTDRLVPVGRVALPPPGQAPVSCEFYERTVIMQEPDVQTITVIGPSEGQRQFLGMVLDAGGEHIETRHYYEATEVGSVAQKIYSAVRENVEDPNYTRDRNHDRDTEVIYYPRGYITLSTTYLDNKGLNHTKELTGFRLCTTQLAMDLYFKLIKAEVFIEPLPAERRDENRPLEKSHAILDDEGNPTLGDRRIQDDHERFQVCGRVDVESWVAKKEGTRYRKVTASEPDDYTVVAYFQKPGASSPWEQIDVENFNARVQRLTHLERQMWIFRMEKYNSEGGDNQDKGGGTMYLTNGITGESYYVLDPGYVLDGCDQDIGITIRRTFGGDRGLQWAICDDKNVSRLRGRRMPDGYSTLSLWVQLSNGNSIQDVCTSLQVYLLTELIETRKRW